MKFQRTLTFLLSLAAVVSGSLFAWTHAGNAQQDQSAKKNSQTPTIEEY